MERSSAILLEAIVKNRRVAERAETRNDKRKWAPDLIKRRKHRWYPVFSPWLTSLILGSLFFSEVMMYPPCILCWYQRICVAILWYLSSSGGLFPLGESDPILFASRSHWQSSRFITTFFAIRPESAALPSGDLLRDQMVRIYHYSFYHSHIIIVSLLLISGGSFSMKDKWIIVGVSAWLSEQDSGSGKFFFTRQEETKAISQQETKVLEGAFATNG